MTKKLKNTPGIGRKIIDRVNWNKREVLAIAILFTAMITLLSLGLYSQHTSKADREDVVRMRHITQMIRDKLIGAGSNVKWLDRSHCSVIPMKSFGEKVEYSCTASYRWSGLVRDQDDIDSKINLHKQVLSDIEDVIIEVIDHGGSPVYTIDSNILGRPSYDKIDHTSAYEF